MTQSDPRARRSRAFDSAVRAVLPIIAALGVGGPVHAEERRWNVKLEPVYTAVYGHDPHVLTIHDRDLDSAPTLDSKTGVSLDTDDGLAYRVEFQYSRGQWAWGVDYFLLLTSQSAADRTAAADGPAGPIEEVVFEVADRSFTSTDPSEVLFYSVLEDTDLEIWTADFYGVRTLAEKPDSSIRLQIGLRVGDFDNDYRAVVGVQGVNGSRLDASSNYPLMMGPLVGLAGSVRRGRNSIEGSIGQSLLIGSAELSSMSREFTGPFSVTPTFVAQERFEKDQDVAIPITEFRVRWTCRLGDHVSLGAGVDTSLWWDVPVPPGVVPIENGDEALHENTVVLFGLLGSVNFTF
jgi:hypothetical protein